LPRRTRSSSRRVCRKTRSGKIMRRILRKIAEDEFDNLGDTSTLADPGVVDDLIDNRQNKVIRCRVIPKSRFVRFGLPDFGAASEEPVILASPDPSMM
jgi:hypothetical protein